MRRWSSKSPLRAPTARRRDQRIQFPGQRAAGARFLELVRLSFLKSGLVHNPSLPNFHRKPGTYILLDTHMDDWHGTGRRSEAEPFV